MPEHLRALVFILALAVPIFVLAKMPITAQACTLEDFKRRRNMWFALTLAAFLAHNIWVFSAVATVMLIYAMRTEGNAFALYLALMLAVPRVAVSIPGFGLMNELFVVEPLRLLSLFVLLPAYLKLRKQPGIEPFGQLLCDKLLLATFALELALTLPHRTFTSVIRDSVFYAFTNTFLIYYVASRGLRTPKAFRDALGAFTVAALVFCAVLVIEFARRWLLYSSLDAALGVRTAERGYLLRSGMLRAEATGGQAIAAGFVAAVAIGLYLYVRTLIPNPLMRRLGMALLIAGVIGAFSRAPWLGAAGSILVFMLLGPSPMGNLFKLFGVLLLAVPILLGTDSGAVIIDHLPWVGKVDSQNVDGREHLANVAVRVIMQNPFFGNFDFALNPDIEALRGSDGIIDLVNTYVMVALKGGIVSVVLFVVFIAATWLGALAALFRLEPTEERHVLGRALVGTLLGCMFIIGTMSPIFFVYPLIWTLAGLCVGFRQMVVREADQAARTKRAQTLPPGVSGTTARQGSTG